MPSKRPSGSRLRNQRLCHLQGHGYLMTLHCTCCGQRAEYWVDDLVGVVGPDHETHVSPFSCSRCKTPEFIRLDWRIPKMTELQAGLVIRRPVKQVKRWIWRNQRA